MKTPVLTAVVIALFSLFPAFAEEPDSDQIGVTSETFYNNEALNEHGRWLQVEQYGRCWQPNNVPQGWRPYTRGGFQHSQCGWTWVSDESEAEWGWAAFHYGRWLQLEGVGCGWAWVPGTVWGPAWVSWRSGNVPDCTCVGWAPLPPEVKCQPGVGVSTAVEREADIGPGAYTFVEARRLGERNYHGCGCIIDRRRYVDIVRHTVNITNISYRRDLNVGVGINIYNGGPDREWCDRESRQYGGGGIAQISISRVGQVEAFRSFRGYRHMEGNSLTIFAPEITVTTRSSKNWPKIATTVSTAKVIHGWEMVKDKKQREMFKREIVQQTKDVPNNAPAKLDPRDLKHIQDVADAKGSQKQNGGSDPLDPTNTAARFGLSPEAMAEYQKLMKSYPDAKSDPGTMTELRNKLADMRKGNPNAVLTDKDIKQAFGAYYDKGSLKQSGSTGTNAGKQANASGLPGASPEPTNAWLDAMKDQSAPPVTSVPPGVASKDRQDAATNSDLSGKGVSRFREFNRHHGEPTWLTDAAKTNGWSDDETRQVLRDYNQKSSKINVDTNLTDAQKQQQTDALKTAATKKNAPSLVDPSAKEDFHWLTTQDQQLKSPEQTLPGLADGSTGGSSASSGKMQVPAGSLLPNTASTFNEKLPDLPNPDAPGTRIGTAVSTNVPSDTGNADGSTGGDTSHTGKGSTHSSQNGNNPSGSKTGNTQIGSALSTTIPSGTPQIGSATSIDEKGNVTNVPDGTGTTRIGTAISTDIPSDSGNANGGQGGIGPNGQGQGSNQTRIGTAVSTDIPSGSGNTNAGQGSDQTQAGELKAAVTDPAEIAKIQANFQAAFDANLKNGTTQNSGASVTNDSTQGQSGSQTSLNQQGRGKGGRHPGQSFKNGGQANANGANGNATGTSNTADQSSSNGQKFQNNNSKLGASGDGSGAGNGANSFQEKQGKGTGRPGQHLNAKTSANQGQSTADSSDASQIGSASGKSQDGTVTDMPPGGSDGSTSVSRSIKIDKKGKVTELPLTGSENGNDSVNAQNGKQNGKHKGKRGPQVVNQSQVSTSNNSGTELKQQSNAGSVESNQSGNQSGKSQRKLSRKQQRQLDPQAQSQSDTSSGSNNSGGGGGKKNKRSQSQSTLQIAPQNTATSTSQTSSSSDGGGRKHKQQNNQSQIQQQSQSSSQSQGDGNGGGRGGKKGKHQKQPETVPTP